MTLSVLMSFKQPTGSTNPYITQLHRALLATPELTVATFSWRAALLGHWDVFHVHWPETMIYSPRRLLRLAKLLLLGILLIRLKSGHAAVVSTYHNVGAHEQQGWLGRHLLARLRRLIVGYIVLNPHSQPPADRLTWLIPHGHYRDWYARYDRARAVPGRLATFGLIRPYKGVEELLAAFAGWTDPAASLTIGGKPADPDTGERVAQLGSADPRVALVLRFLGEQELVTLATEAELLVFPYVAMHNSGAVLAGLSLGRPVLAPRNAVNEALAREVGQQWVQLYDGTLTPAVLTQALASVRTIQPDAMPDLSDRDWDLAGVKHLQAYREAVTKARGRAA